jgi:NADH-quinone oxidoreductase subunit J
MSAAVLHTLSAAGQTSTAEAILFWCLAPIMVLAGIGLLVVKKAVHAALLVITIMISLAILYIAQGAVFLGMVQVVVYTGAVMMLFLFVLMLVGVDGSDSLVETIRGQRWIALIAGAGLACVLVGVVATSVYEAKGFTGDAVNNNPTGIAAILFGQYVFAFEVVGALLVTAALGALVLTHRQRLVPRVGQKERADARVASGATLTPLPAPGVYARHNAMDVPALGPDGQPLESSVPRVLRIRGQEADADAFAARIDKVLAGGSAVAGRPLGGPDGTGTAATEEIQ